MRYAISTTGGGQFARTDMQKCKVLFLSANPLGTSLVQLDEEIRAIREKIRASENRDAIELIPYLAARPDDFQQALLEHKPAIVHFSGHGSASGELIAVDANGGPKRVDKDALVWLFKTLRDNVKVVLLNCCYSHVQAAALSEIIDCTIGMKDKIGNQAAILFAASFYRALGFGRTVQEAFDSGKSSLLLEGVREEDTPAIWTRAGVDASTITPVEATTGIGRSTEGKLPGT